MAMNHAPRHARRAAQLQACAPEVARADRLPDGAATHGHAVHFNGTDDLNVEAAAPPPLTQRLRTAGAAVPEAHPVPNDHGAYSQSIDEQAAHELVSTDRG